MSYAFVYKAHKQAAHQSNKCERLPKWLVACASVLLCFAASAQACAHHDHYQHSSGSSRGDGSSVMLHALPVHHAELRQQPAEPQSIEYEDWSNEDIFSFAVAKKRKLLNSGSTAGAAAVGATIDRSSGSNAPAPKERPGPRCGTRNVTPTEHEDVQWKLMRSRLAASRLSAQQAGRMSIASAPAPASLTVSLYFHVITGGGANSTVYAPTELLAQQLDVMNSAYGPFNIRFALKGVSRVLSEEWATTEINTDAETQMKGQLRK